LPQIHEKYDEIKRKIRKLKKLELKIRFQSMNYQEINQIRHGNTGRIKLVWDEFFDLNAECTKKINFQLAT